jgi:hypothetical protein
MFPGDMDMLGNMTFYMPPPPGRLELNLGDAWRAHWIDADTLPIDAPVAYGYVLLVMDGKGYVSRPATESNWGTIEAPVQAGETQPAWLKRTLQEQANATIARSSLVGYLYCRATSHNPEHPAGTVTVRPVYVVVAKQVKDMAAGSRFQRRRLPMNEYTMALRRRYPEMDLYLIRGLDSYIIEHAKTLA